MNIDEPVELSNYNPQWQIEAEREISRIEGCLSSPLPKLEHIGSTAVPGLLAKPIVDLMLGVASYPPSDALELTIRNAGYEGFGEAGVPGRIYFRKRGILAINLHVVQHQGSHWKNNIALRDLLRADAQARQRYEDSKLAAINAGVTSLIAYSAAKASTIERLIAQATAT